jgi:ribosomal protein S14
MAEDAAATEQPAVAEDSAAPAGQAASEAAGTPAPQEDEDESSKAKEKPEKPKKIPQCQVSGVHDGGLRCFGHAGPRRCVRSPAKH